MPSRADQFMDYNYIFKTSAQKIAVTFGFSHLEENEIHDLLAGLDNHLLRLTTEAVGKVIRGTLLE